MEPQLNESQALASCDRLIRYAAENIFEDGKKNTLSGIVTVIEQTWDAVNQKKWNADTASKFWVAYNNLCALTNPVSADTLTTNDPTLTEKRWIFFGSTSKISAPHRSAERYLIVFVLLLISTVMLSFVTSTATGIGGDLKDLIKSADESSKKVEGDISALRAKGVGWPEKLTNMKNKAAQGDADKLRNDLTELYFFADKVYGKADSAKIILLEPYPVCQDNSKDDKFCYSVGGSGIADNLQDAQSNVDHYQLLRRRSALRADQALGRANLLKSTVLAVLLGMMGACAYVIRLISEQIKGSSFSSTSPIRHFVRVTLGALAGVAIGFGGIVSENSVSAAALSFLAGYSIEPVFATFDSIAEKFRR